jgi:hypothetical protein
MDRVISSLRLDLHRASALVRVAVNRGDFHAARSHGVRKDALSQLYRREDGPVTIDFQNRTGCIKMVSADFDARSSIDIRNAALKMA